MQSSQNKAREKTQEKFITTNFFELKVQAYQERINKLRYIDKIVDGIRINVIEKGFLGTSLVEKAIKAEMEQSMRTIFIKNMKNIVEESSLSEDIIELEKLYYIKYKINNIQYALTLQAAKIFNDYLGLINYIHQLYIMKMRK